MLLGESSNKTDDKTDHNTADEHLKQGINLLKQCDFRPDSIKDLRYNDLILIDYLEKGTLPKLQRDARRLILRSADYIVGEMQNVGEHLTINPNIFNSLFTIT
jgi:hypothetical protein